MIFCLDYLAMSEDVFHVQKSFGGLGAKARTRIGLVSDRIARRILPKNFLDSIECPRVCFPKPLFYTGYFQPVKKRSFFWGEQKLSKHIIPRHNLVHQSHVGRIKLQNSKIWSILMDWNPDKFPKLCRSSGLVCYNLDLPSPTQDSSGK